MIQRHYSRVAAGVILLLSTTVFAERLENTKTVTQIVKEHGTSVVMIITLDRWERPPSFGSGFIVDRAGVIVTNFHVIEDAYAAIVKLKDGRKFKTFNILNFEVTKDIAILKVDALDLPTVVLGDSDKIEIGERVVAVGNPEGLENTVSDGLISGVRHVDADLKLIQTSAPISKGSSGGPLFNMSGNVIGITTLTLARGQNLNFAIPVNYVTELLRQKKSRKMEELWAKPAIPIIKPQEGDEPIFRPAVPAPKTAEETYKFALTEYIKGNYDLAINAFKSYLISFPETSLVPNAQYWLAESYYSKGDYRQAIQEFTKVIKDYPDSTKVPSAMLKQGYAYLELGEAVPGQAVLRELINKFPRSREARLAQDRLERPQ